MLSVMGLVMQWYHCHHCQSTTIATLIMGRASAGIDCHRVVREHRALCRRERSRRLGELRTRQNPNSPESLSEERLFDAVAQHGSS